MAQAMTEGVYGRTMQKCPDPSEKCLPLGEGGFAKQRRMRGGRQFDFECRGEACPASYPAVTEWLKSTLALPGQRKAPLCRGSSQSKGLTEGVYAHDLLKAIVR